MDKPPPIHIFSHFILLNVITTWKKLLLACLCKTKKREKEKNGQHSAIVKSCHIKALCVLAVTKCFVSVLKQFVLVCIFDVGALFEMDLQLSRMDDRRNQAVR